jgi:penicillin-binding protein 2
MRSLVLHALLAGMLTACTALGTPTTAPTPAPPTPVPTAYTPDARGTAQAFLDAWTRFDYAGMYTLISPLSQAAIAEGTFVQRYDSTMRTATASSVSVGILSELRTGSGATILFDVTLHTAVFGPLARRIEMPLVYDQGRWSVAWTDGLILPELSGGGSLLFDGSFPARGNIYDRNGLGLAIQGSAVAIGVQPGLISDRATTVVTLAEVLNLSPSVIEQKLDAARPDWYVPLGEVTAADAQARLSDLQALAGVTLSPYNSRYYPLGGVAPQVVGYLSQITPDQTADYRGRGYTGDERVGAVGLEAWGELYLAGQRGGRLIASRPDGSSVVLAESQRRPAQAITTTLDRQLQLAAQDALRGFRGSVVVLDPKTGAVLAMASSPSFDPNVFDPTTRDPSLQQAILTDPARPLLLRATQGAYPAGSVFKLAVAAAGMLSGVIAADTIVPCNNTWSGLGPNAVKYNWTFTRGLRAPGPINVVQALAFSCNPFFYEIAFEMDAQDPEFLPEVARDFGFGAFTGIGAVPEAQGLIPDPEWKLTTYNDEWRPGDSVNMGIGQGFVLVTPLQVARMTAALANGGTLYRPQLVAQIAPPDGDPTFTLTPDSVGRLPIDSEQLEVIRAGMLWVTSEKGGTARHHFLNLGIPVYGKTGTAEDPGAGAPHAWFAGYTSAGRGDIPDFAAVVMIENIGDGSEYAAPIFRRLVEVWFNGQALTPLPWETAVPATPEAETPSPGTIVVTPTP